MEAFGTTVQPFLAWLLETTLIASVVICLILVLQKLLGRRLGPRWSHALWLVLLLRMVLPWTPPSPVSLFSLIPAPLQRDASREITDIIPREDALRPADSAGTTEGTTGTAPPLAELPAEPTQMRPRNAGTTAHHPAPLLGNVRRILPLLWLVGAILIGGYLAASNFTLWRIIKREHPLVEQSILELFEQCKSQMGVETIVALVPSDEVKTAALFGFVRPRLLLPREMLETTDPEELRYIFLHELAHLKRHDIYLGWLTSVLQVLHWFNPLVWFAFYRMRSDRELACDALVLTRTNEEESHDYGRTMVGLLGRFSRSRPLPAMAGILESKSQLKRRIAMITQFKKNSYQWSPLAVILIIILACISLPDAKPTRASETLASKPTHQPNFRKIRIPTKLGNGVLSPDGKKLAFVSEESIWVVPVHGKVSPDIAGEPVRLSGTEGAWDWCYGISWSADGKWIAYKTLKNDMDEICIVPSSGGKVKRISVKDRDGIWSRRLSLSTDGKIVAFVASNQLFTAHIEDGDVNQLTENGGTQPAFSPDGKKIAYVKDKPQKTEIPAQRDVWVIPAAGGTPIQVSDLPGMATGPIWSPDGKMIAFTRRAEDEICIVPVSETGNPEAPPTQIELPLVARNFLAGWTPDNKIGVHLINPEHLAIYTVPASGGNATQVTPKGYTYHPRWSPDGDRIHFRWGGGDLASVPSEGGEVSTIPIRSDTRIFEALPGGGNAVSPDGEKIVFSGAKMVVRDNKKAYEVDIYTIPIEGGEPNKLTISPAQDRFPCWSPDGKSIAFVRAHEKSTEGYLWNIYIIPSKGGDVRQLISESDDVHISYIDWSPDGKLIAYFSEDKAIKVIPAQGGESRVVVKVEDWSGHSELAWSPDGSKLVYSSKGSIWVVSLDGGEPEKIRTGLDAKASHISWSPDGEKMAFSAIRDGDVDLWLMENFLPAAVARASR